MHSALAPGLARRVMPFAPVQRRALVIQNAQKKGSGSTKNGRDSNAQRRGVKVFGGQDVRAGGIIIRQLGSTWHDGNNTSLGKDYTLYSLIDGVVIFDKKKERPSIHVYPHDHEKALAAKIVTHTIHAKEGVPSRQQRRKAMYTPRGSSPAPAAAAAAP